VEFGTAGRTDPAAGRPAFRYSPRVQRFDGKSYLSLATFKRDGSEVPTPVWFARLDDRLYVFSEAKAGKIKRLRNSPRSRVAVCNVSGTVRGDWIEAVSKVVDDQELIDRVYVALRAKYGWQMALANFFSTLSGRIDNRAVIQIEI
jgi:PPOX class probable F420-dependent enzyme